MRILFLYHVFTAPTGAWSTRAYEFARRWVKAGDQVTIVTCQHEKSGLDPKGLIAHFNIEGVEVRVINVKHSNKSGKLARILNYGVFALASTGFALTHRYDVMLASSGPLTIGFPALLAHKLRRKPFVFEVRDLWPEGAIQLGLMRGASSIRFWRAFERACYKNAARIVALSEGMANEIRKLGFSDVDVIPNACDNELFGPRREFVAPEWAQGKKVVLYTGSIGQMDDCRQLIEMAAVLQQRGADDISVVLIGDGKERVMVETLAAEKKLTNVRFLGLLPKNEVVGWLQNARCALLSFKNLPALHTVSPNKMFDAFAAGTPVVQTTQGWIADLLTREKCGLTARPDDAEDFATQVQLLCDDDPLRREFAGNAKRLAIEVFDRDLLSLKMRENLKQAMN
jgi:glycosyltransferase involved in cell wall biosynthesis